MRAPSPATIAKNDRSPGRPRSGASLWARGSPAPQAARRTRPTQRMPSASGITALKAEYQPYEASTTTRGARTTATTASGRVPDAVREPIQRW